MHPELQKIDTEMAHTRNRVRDFAIIVFAPPRHLLVACWPAANAQTGHRCAARARTSAGSWKMYIRQVLVTAHVVRASALPRHLGSAAVGGSPAGILRNFTSFDRTGII
jgi:hypothetical protein